MIVKRIILTLEKSELVFEVKDQNIERRKTTYLIINDDDRNQVKPIEGFFDIKHFRDDAHPMILCRCEPEKVDETKAAMIKEMDFELQISLAWHQFKLNKVLKQLEDYKTSIQATKH